MSLLLNMGTQPEDLIAKTHSHAIDGMPPRTLFLGDYEITMEDFIVLARYVLTNTDLEPNDPRLRFVKQVKSMEVVSGWNANNNPRATRLQTTSE